MRSRSSGDMIMIIRMWRNSSVIGILGLVAAGPATTQPDLRAAAGERIEKNCKADLIVKVVDGNAKPRSGVEVHVKMTRHAFGFGTCVNASIINDDAPRFYREQIAKLFNKVVTENDLKWQTWEGAYPRFTHERS